MSQLTMFNPDSGGRETPTKTEQPYPWGPGHREADTSKAAAVEIEAIIAPLREQALRWIKYSMEYECDGLTADEVAEEMHESVLAIRPRITELHKLGHIVDSGKRRKNASGKMAIVWVAA